MISPAQAYHGALFGALALTGRRSLQAPYGEYLPSHLHIAPSTWRFDPSGEAALRGAGPPAGGSRAADDRRVLLRARERGRAAGLSPGAFWQGLDERRRGARLPDLLRRSGHRDGPRGSWLAAHQLPIEPDIVAMGKGLGAGYAPLAATLCTKSITTPCRGSREFDLGHTWDGAPLPCGVGLAVLDALTGDGLVERVSERGPQLRDGMEAALGALRSCVRSAAGGSFSASSSSIPATGVVPPRRARRGLSNT